MINLKRKLAPVQRKPRMKKTITKKMRKPTLAGLKSNNPSAVPDKGWSNSDITQSYTKV